MTNAMTASDVRTCLLKRWPASEYLSIDEAPETADRQGRKLDVLVLSLWRSRGYERDGVEIKVSASDWKRELDNAGKADWWWHHVHRFWVAVPETIAVRVSDDLPSGWGLLACTPSASTVVVKPLKHDPIALTWGATLGLLRAASGAGFNALQRAESAGYQRGAERATARAEQASGDAALRDRLQALKDRMAAFESASGLDLTACWSVDDANNLGQLVKWIRAGRCDPQYIADTLTRQAAQLESQAQGLRGTAKTMTESRDFPT